MNGTEPGTEPTPDVIIEIRDPEIDDQQIMAEIRARMERRRAELGYEPQNFISFGGARYPGKPDDIPYDADFYHHLELANELYQQVETESNLQPSPATRVPLLGRLWGLIRSQAHYLVLYYVNRSLAHQMNVNRELVSTLNRLALMNQEKEREIYKLRTELDVLRTQAQER